MPLNSPQSRWDHRRKSSNTRGANCESAELDGISDYKHTYLHFDLPHEPQDAFGGRLHCICIFFISFVSYANIYFSSGFLDLKTFLVGIYDVVHPHLIFLLEQSAVCSVIYIQCICPVDYKALSPH